MKCEHCNNEMVWEGSLRGGHLTCPHCESITDHDYNLRVKEIYESAMMVKKGDVEDPLVDYMDYDI